MSWRNRARATTVALLTTTTLAVATHPAEARDATTLQTACSVAYEIDAQWIPGFLASIVITNTGTTPTSGSGWTLTFDFPDGQTVSLGHSARWNQTGSTVTVTNPGWNPVLNPGTSATVGFTGAWTGQNTEPTAFQLNGASCAVV